MSLQNYHRTLQKVASEDTFQRKHKTFYPFKSKEKQASLANAANQRANMKSKMTVYDNELNEVLQNGLTPTIHPDHHDFRPRDEKKEIQREKIYLRKYMPEKVRVVENAEKYRSEHLEGEPYKGNPDFAQPVKNSEKELHPPLRWGVRTEYERVKRDQDKGVRLIDTAPYDPKMIQHPSWKDDIKSKWVGKKNFDLTANYLFNFSSKRGKDPWKMVNPFITIGDPYTDGVEVVGDLSRKRNKTRELAKRDFQLVVSPTTEKLHADLQSRSCQTAKFQRFRDKKMIDGVKFYPKSLKEVQSEFNLPKAISHESSIEPRFSEPPQQEKPEKPKIRVNQLQFAKSSSSLGPQFIKEMGGTMSSTFGINNRALSKTRAETFGSKSFVNGLLSGNMFGKKMKDAGIEKKYVIKKCVDYYFDEEDDY